MIVPDEIFTNGTDVRKGTPGVLYRNGEPIHGKDSFEQNRLRTVQLSKIQMLKMKVDILVTEQKDFSLIVRQSKFRQNGPR